MIDIRIIVIFLVFPSLFSLFIVWSAYHSFFYIKKSKTARKKISKSMGLWHKFLLLYPMDVDSLCYKRLKILRRLYFVMLFVFLFCILLLLFTIIFSLNKNVLIYCVASKVVVLDIPTGIFFFFMSKHGKNGGVVWRWE